MAEALRASRRLREDPCPYDGATWSALRQTTGLRFALDRGTAEEASTCSSSSRPCRRCRERRRNHHHLVHGPSGRAVFRRVRGDRFSSTHGLFTHVLYEPDPFIDAVRADGPRLLPPAGTGIGFDDLLDKLPWQRLA